MFLQVPDLLFAHIMAGGVPRAKIYMPTQMNRVFKKASANVLNLPRLFGRSLILGHLAAMNFEEVTANTLQYLLEGSAALRARIEKGGGRVSYLAYGYHGTEVMVKKSLPMANLHSLCARLGQN